MRASEELKAKLSLILAMVIWGSIGIFRRYIPLSSGLIAMLRGGAGMLFLLILTLVRGKRPSWPDIRRNALPLLLSGAFIALNWILLFEAYRYTSVAAATLCYYMAPMIVLLLSPIVLKERLSPRKLLCLPVALLGMALVSGVFESDVSGSSEMPGILLGLAAAVLYACVILTNKRISAISSMDRTITQLGVAALILLPYNLLTENLFSLSLSPLSAAMLAIVCIVHTGIAYALYFGSMRLLRAQTVALFSYIDPVVAILLSALVLKEGLSLPGLIGAALTLGSIIVCELPERPNRRK